MDSLRTMRLVWIMEIKIDLFGAVLLGLKEKYVEAAKRDDVKAIVVTGTFHSVVASLQVFLDRSVFVPGRMVIRFACI